jgi:hypothetical protein
MSHATRGPASTASGDRRPGEFAPAADTQRQQSGKSVPEAAR